jgi:hypothetical protein
LLSVSSAQTNIVILELGRARLPERSHKTPTEERAPSVPPYRAYCSSLRC